MNNQNNLTNNQAVSDSSFNESANDDSSNQKLVSSIRKRASILSAKTTLQSMQQDIQAIETITMLTRQSEIQYD